MGETEKTYLAVVHGRCRTHAETITTYLAENKAHVVYSTSDPAKGKLARTAYRLLKQTKDFALLEVNLLTGRKNQIRVHLAGIGHPIVGDRKYGDAKEPRGDLRAALPVDHVSAPRQRPTTDPCGEGARAFFQAGWRHQP